MDSSVHDEEVRELIASLQKEIAKEPDECCREAMTAKLLVAEGRHTDALPYFERCILALRGGQERNPLLWSDYFVRTLGCYAMTLDYLGELDRADEVYRECISLNPAGFFLGEYAVFLHRRRRDFVQAQAYYERSLELYPTQSSIHLKFAAFLRHVRRDLKLAEHHYKLSIESNPRNPDALGSYASFLHGVSGDSDLAETYYVQAVELDRTHANNLCNYGLFLSEEKQQYVAAESYYKQVLLHTPNHANTLYNYAVMLDSHLGGRKGDAEVYYRRAIEVEPRHAFALYNLAVLLEDKALNAEVGDAGDSSLAQAQTSDDLNDPSLTPFERKMKRRKEVCEFYKRAHHADVKDVTTAADYGRYLVTKMVLSRSELKEVQGSSAPYTLATEQYVKTADAVLQGALDSDGKCIVALYNYALLHQKYMTGINNLSLLENLEKAETFLKTLLRETRGKHAAAMQQLGRVFIDKFKALGNKEECNVIELAMECYENTINMKLEKSVPNPKSSSSPQAVLLEYLKVVSNFANNKQKMRGVAYIENFMSKIQEQYGNLSAVITHELDIRQMLSNLGTIIRKGKPEEAEKKRR